MDKHPIGDLMNTTMSKIREMVDVNTIIGKPIEVPGGMTLIPVSKVSFGFASGGSDFAVKNSTSPEAFGGGSGAGVNITPVAFIVINGDSIRALPIAQDAPTGIDKLIDSAPDLIDKISGTIKKKEPKE